MIHPSKRPKFNQNSTGFRQDNFDFATSESLSNIRNHNASCHPSSFSSKTKAASLPSQYYIYLKELKRDGICPNINYFSAHQIQRQQNINQSLEHIPIIISDSSVQETHPLDRSEFDAATRYSSHYLSDNESLELVQSDKMQATTSHDQSKQQHLQFLLSQRKSSLTGLKYVRGNSCLESSHEQGNRRSGQRLQENSEHNGCLPSDRHTPLLLSSALTNMSAYNTEVKERFISEQKSKMACLQREFRNVQHLYAPDQQGHNRGCLEKPPFSFPCLIGFAFLDGEKVNEALAVSDIYKRICARFPYFETAKKGWKNSIRHNLSLNKFFTKIEKTVPDVKGNLWALNPNMIELMKRDIVQCEKKAKLRQADRRSHSILNHLQRKLDGGRLVHDNRNQKNYGDVHKKLQISSPTFCQIPSLSQRSLDCVTSSATCTTNPHTAPFQPSLSMNESNKFDSDNDFRLPPTNNCQIQQIEVEQLLGNELTLQNDELHLSRYSAVTKSEEDNQLLSNPPSIQSKEKAQFSQHLVKDIKQSSYPAKEKLFKSSIPNQGSVKSTNTRTYSDNCTSLNPSSQRNLLSNEEQLQTKDKAPFLLPHGQQLYTLHNNPGDDSPPLSQYSLSAVSPFEYPLCRFADGPDELKQSLENSLHNESLSLFPREDDEFTATNSNQLASFPLPDDDMRLNPLSLPVCLTKRLLGFIDYTNTQTKFCTLTRKSSSLNR